MARQWRSRPERHAEQFSGARLAASDARVAFLLMKEARDRTMERLLGVPRNQSNLATLFLLALLADAVHDKAEQLLKGPGGPTRADAVLGGAALRELVHGVAGPSSRGTPFFGTLVAIAVLGGLSRPVVRASARSVRASSHQARAMFNRRYGHLIRPR